MATQRLLLVDALGAIYRAFYAIRELSTRDGRPTNAVFGFIRMMGMWVRTWEPSHVAVVFDGGLPETRTAALPEYKAQRPRMPDPLREQVTLIEEYLDCAGIAWTRVEGQEADDVIASVARWAEAEAERVLVASSDKDLYQILNDTIGMVSVSGDRFAGPRDVAAKTGVEPDRIAEWLALVGDSSDNIPGVPGVGAKTAARLLTAYGSLDGVWAHLSDIKSERTRRGLEEHRERVERNLGLVTLRTDLACPFRWEDMALRTPDTSRLIPFLEGLEFTSLARELREPELFK